MKVQCDVCNQQEASVFCCADEAALCDACDRRVHSANKLAGKHRRFSLLRPSHSPLCDICQEKKAFLFCQEDRALLCRDCDAPIHAANEHTSKHNRFLLTGIKLSATAAPVAASESGSSSVASEVEESDASTRKKTAAGGHHQPAPSAAVSAAEEERCNLTSSTISDYLIKTLPGWHVEDLLLDEPSPVVSSVDILSKMGIGDDLLPFLDAQKAARGWWVPQVPQVGTQSQNNGSQQWGHVGGGIGHGVGNQQVQRWGKEDVFAVPQMMQQHQHGSSNKRPRAMWYST